MGGRPQDGEHGDAAGQAHEAHARQAKGQRQAHGLERDDGQNRSAGEPVGRRAGKGDVVGRDGEGGDNDDLAPIAATLRRSLQRAPIWTMAKRKYSIWLARFAACSSASSRSFATGKRSIAEMHRCRSRIRAAFVRPENAIHRGVGDAAHASRAASLRTAHSGPCRA